MNEVSDTELKKVIADFLEMGHVENIVAMFRKESLYYDWTADLLLDERFNVRLGLAVLFEELQIVDQKNISLAIPSLQPLLHHDSPLIRGETIGILGLINTPSAIALVKRCINDISPQVREMVAMTLQDV